MAEFKPTVRQLIEVARLLSETRADRVTTLPDWVAEHNIHYEQFFALVADALESLAPQEEEVNAP